MTAEPIARVVADLRTGRVKYPESLTEELVELAEWGGSYVAPVIDSTSIYESLADRTESISLYGDHTIPPAWEGADICYVNGHGNVLVIATFTKDRAKVGDGWDPTPDWGTDEPTDWTQARWAIYGMVFVGGRSDTFKTPMITQGPVLMLEYAVGTHGEPLDLHWVDLMRKAASSTRMPKEWDMAMLVHLATLDFLACRNVEVVPVQHSNRSARRRMERTGITVNTLTVKAIGKSSKGAALSGNHGVPLTSVRGHFAHYGDCCPGRHQPRGLAFGRLQGRFWVPQHARGDAELGEHQNDYRLETG